MSPTSIAILAIGMSVDALIAAVGRGAGLGRARLAEALRTGLVFGAVETITPMIGWAAGVAANRYVAAVDHWIAVGLLALVGGRMIANAFGAPNAEEARSDRSMFTLLATAIGTSIDAMVVGVSLAFLDVNIVLVALTIGLATFLMSTCGMIAGRLIGPGLGRIAEIAGGLALIGLGGSILLSHLLA
ncbi:manganese efflux pump MntP family protein [Phreatobacter oligotrophus]|uniref:manganese efflux pump MntP n=1 Tax=Phreatobacter oligotrophus TaxID=1122261 RepID=UPI002357FC75|nr:manganese efflux pump [Phreatobacter oligotrophus]MBX9991285.1 manganese efflux pump [Phreatobacter oligotrophus]